jgi:transposase
MATNPVIGIDVARAHLDVAVEGQSGTLRLPNDVAGRRRLVRHVRRQQPRLVVFEASGGYEQALMESLWAAQLPLARVNPRMVRAFARASGRRAKTDALDAALLVRFGRVMELAAQAPPSPARQELARLQARSGAAACRRDEPAQTDSASGHPRQHRARHRLSGGRRACGRSRHG